MYKFLQILFLLSKMITKIKRFFLFSWQYYWLNVYDMYKYTHPSNNLSYKLANIVTLDTHDSEKTLKQHK